MTAHPRELDPFDPAARRANRFEIEARRDKATKILRAIDSSCRMCGLPIPAGKSGVAYIMELPATAWLEIHRVAKCNRPPSAECLKVLLDLVRNR